MRVRSDRRPSAPVVAGQAGPRQKSLDAARLAAIAAPAPATRPRAARAMDCDPIRRRSHWRRSTILPPMTTPPPTPVPRITPKTMSHPAAAPSIGFGQGKAIGVVGEADGPAERRLRSRPRVGRSARSNWRFSPARFAPKGFRGCRRPLETPTPQLGLDAADQPDNRSDGSGIVASRRRDPPPRRTVPLRSMAAASILVPPRSTPMRNAAVMSAPIPGVAVCSVNDRLHQILQIPRGWLCRSLAIF